MDAEFRFERYAAALNKKRWKETGEAGVGLVYDLGSHLMDMAVDIFGMPDELYADVRYQHEGAVSDDNFYIALYYADGKKVALTASKYAREPLPFMTLHGKRDHTSNKTPTTKKPCCSAARNPSERGTVSRKTNGASCTQKSTGRSSVKQSKASAEIMQRFMKTFTTRCKANLPQ